MPLADAPLALLAAPLRDPQVVLRYQAKMAEPVLVDPEGPDQPRPVRRLRDVLGAGPSQLPHRRWPTDSVLAGDPVDRADLPRQRGHNPVPEPSREPGPGRDLVGGLGERRSSTTRLAAAPPLLDPTTP